MTDYNGFSWYDIDFNDAEKIYRCRTGGRFYERIMKSIDNIKTSLSVRRKNQYDGIFAKAEFLRMP